MKLHELTEAQDFAVFIKDPGSIDDGVLFVKAEDGDDAERIVKKSSRGTDYEGFKIVDIDTFDSYAEDYGSREDLEDQIPEKYGDVVVHMLGH